MHMICIFRGKWTTLMLGIYQQLKKKLNDFFYSQEKKWVEICEYFKYRIKCPERSIFAPLPLESHNIQLTFENTKYALN